MAGLALADGVESANVVGYQEFTFPAQPMTMFGIMFDTVGGGDMTVQDIFPDPDGQGFTGGTSKAYADQIMYWTGSTYHVLYLNKSTNAARNGFWCNGQPPPAGGDWGANNAKSTHVIHSGEAFWLNRKTYDAPFTAKMLGQVVVAQDGTKSMTINEGYNLISMPFTASFIPNPDKVDANNAKIDWESKGCVGGTSKAYADQLVFWNGTSYHVLYLNKSTNAGRNGYWCNGQTPATAETLSWGANNTATAVVYPAGGGFWYNRKAGSGSFTLTIDQPYEL